MSQILITSSQKSLRVPRKRIERLVKFVARRESRKLEEVDIAIVDDAEIERCNREFLDHEGTTDVISFDVSESETAPLTAQLVVCADVAIRQARERNLRPTHELMRYVVHGLLHTLGYDDLSQPERTEMWTRQEALLEEFLGS